MAAPAKPPVYRAFFKRSAQQFTLQETQGGKTTKLFDRLAAKSGQNVPQEWIPGKSPIPLGSYRLWTDSIKSGLDEHYDGIGEFFSISTGENRNLIQGKLSGQARWNIGLHWENHYPGSAGCIVLQDSTDEQRANIRSLFKLLRTLGVPYIDLTVIA